jgi:hypothetical protein
MVILHWRNGEYDDYGTFSRWTAIPLYYWINSHGSINNLNEETKLFMIDKYWNVVADMIVDMVKR